METGNWGVKWYRMGKELKKGKGVGWEGKRKEAGKGRGRNRVIHSLKGRSFGGA